MLKNFVVVVEFVVKREEREREGKGLPFYRVGCRRGTLGALFFCGYVQKTVTIAQPRAAVICGCGDHTPSASRTVYEVFVQGLQPYPLALPHIKIGKFTDFWRGESLFSSLSIGGPRGFCIPAPAC